MGEERHKTSTTRDELVVLQAKYDRLYAAAYALVKHADKSQWTDPLDMYYLRLAVLEG